MPPANNELPKEINYEELFNNSFSYIQCHEDAFFSKFYENFMNQSHEINEVFRNTDINRQTSMLMEAINTMVCFSSTKKTNLYLSKIAHSHSKAYGVTNDMYSLFIDSFLMTLEQMYPKYNNDYGLAWRMTLAPGIEYMRHAD